MIAAGFLPLGLGGGDLVVLLDPAAALAAIFPFFFVEPFLPLFPLFDLVPEFFAVFFAATALFVLPPDPALASTASFFEGRSVWAPVPCLSFVPESFPGFFVVFSATALLVAMALGFARDLAFAVAVTGRHRRCRQRSAARSDRRAARGAARE